MNSEVTQETVEEQEPVRILQLFKSTLPSCQYITKEGRYLHFKDGRFATDDAEDIAELEKEISRGHPHIYKDKKERTITSEQLADPMAEIKKKAIAEFLKSNPELAELAKAAAASRDMGTTTQPANLGIGTSANMGAVSADSNSAVGKIQAAKAAKPAAK